MHKAFCHSEPNGEKKKAKLLTDHIFFRTTKIPATSNIKIEPGTFFRKYKLNTGSHLRSDQIPKRGKKCEKPDRRAKA